MPSTVRFPFSKGDMLYCLPDGTETRDRAKARAAWVNGAIKSTRLMYLGRFALPQEKMTDACCKALERAAHATAKLFDEVHG